MGVAVCTRGQRFIRGRLMSDCCDQWRPLVSDQRPCPWTPLVFPLLIRVLARLSFFCLGRTQSFCWSRRLANYLYNNSSELSFDASVYITNSLERSGYASMIFWLFHLNRFKSLLIDINFVSSENWLWAFIGNPLFCKCWNTLPSLSRWFSNVELERIKRSSRYAHTYSKSCLEYIWGDWRSLTSALCNR